MTLTENSTIFSMEFGLRMHERCLAGEITAFDELAELYFVPLVAHIKRANPAWSDHDDHVDAVTNAITSYKKRPSSYDTTKLKSLFRYLIMSAQGDFLNLIESHKRHNYTEASTHVENGVDSEEHELPIADDEDFVESILNNDSRVYKDIDALFDDSRDRLCARCILDQERDTQVYVAIYGLSHLPPDEQEHEVKKHKDRVKKRMLRNLDRKDYLVHD